MYCDVNSLGKYVLCVPKLWNYLQKDRTMSLKSCRKVIILQWILFEWFLFIFLYGLVLGHFSKRYKAGLYRKRLTVLLLQQLGYGVVQITLVFIVSNLSDSLTILSTFFVHGQIHLNDAKVCIGNIKVLTVVQHHESFDRLVGFCFGEIFVEKCLYYVSC